MLIITSRFKTPFDVVSGRTMHASSPHGNAIIYRETSARGAGQELAALNVIVVS